MSEALFDTRSAAEVAFAKQEAMERSERGADLDWMHEALFAVQYVAMTREFLTTDDVARAIEGTQTPDTRALGPVMRKAAQKRWIEGTDRYVPSTDPTCHGRPKKCWKSLLFEEAR